MSDLVALSVAQALGVVNDRLAPIQLKVVGEVSGYNASQGYTAIYFSLRDELGKMGVKVWRNQFEKWGIELRDGMVIEVTGRFSIYAKNGSFTFDISSIEIAGEGRLRAQIAALAARLQSEGLMDASRKQPLPDMPETIAVVTSAHGAAVHDVLRTLRRRFPVAQVLFFGTLVEGESAPSSIANALELADSSAAEVVLLVRGGGSFENLLPFSSEEVARAVANMKTPIVTGIGHEPDTSIADMVADLRASTPTAAAEAVTPALEDLLININRDKIRLAQALKALVERNAQRLRSLQSRPVVSDPLHTLMQRGEGLDTLHRRLQTALPHQIERENGRLKGATSRFESARLTLFNPAERRLGTAVAQLEALSPLSVLARGYAAVFDEDKGVVVDSVEKVHVSDSVNVRVSDGTLACLVTSISHNDKS